MMSNNTRPRFGEIWMARLNEIGSVQGGYRPVFVVSNNLNNTHSPTVNIIPITSRGNKRNLPIHVSLENFNDYGLTLPSTMLVEQIATVNASSLDKKLGVVSDTPTLEQIKTAMEIQFPVFVYSDKQISKTA